MQRLLSILLWLYWTVCFHFCLLITAVLFILTWPFDPFREAPNTVLRLLARLIMWPVPCWHFEIRGADFNKINQPTLIVANHQSFLDLPLLCLLPWNMKWVTKKSMLNVPVLGWMIRMSGHIAIDRKSLRSFQSMDSLVKPIEAGIPGMIFPEGTRTTDGSLRSFKRGGFKLAKEYNFKILPIVLEGSHRAMPAGSWTFRFPNTFVISVLEPMDPADYEDANDLKDHARQLIDEERKKIKSSYN